MVHASSNSYDSETSLSYLVLSEGEDSAGRRGCDERQRILYSLCYVTLQKSDFVHKRVLSAEQDLVIPIDNTC